MKTVVYLDGFYYLKNWFGTRNEELIMKECMLEYVYRNEACSLLELADMEYSEEGENCLLKLNKEGIHLLAKHTRDEKHVDIFEVSKTDMETIYWVGGFKLSVFEPNETPSKKQTALINKFMKMIEKKNDQSKFVWVNRLYCERDTQQHERIVKQEGKLGLRLGNLIYVGNNETPVKEGRGIKVVREYTSIPEGASRELLELYMSNRYTKA